MGLINGSPAFRYKGIGDFFRLGNKAGIQPSHAKRLRLQLGKLDKSKSAKDTGFTQMPGSDTVLKVSPQVCVIAASFYVAIDMRQAHV